MSKLPAFQFYPSDWRSDPGVQSLDYFDRGVWFEMLCLMHESSERGKLMLNGKPMPTEALARVLGLDNQKLSSTLTTLLDFGIASRDEATGAIMSRRMVRDEELRQIRIAAGKLGGNPVLLNQNANQTASKTEAKRKQTVKQNPTPSSSSLISSSNIRIESNDSISTAVAEVFEFWQTTMNHPLTKLDRKRRAKIEARLKEGFTPEQLKDAIRGNKASPFYQGDNDRATVFDSIDLIFRDAEKVEHFIRMKDGVKRNGHRLPTLEERRAEYAEAENTVIAPPPSATAAN